MNPKWHAKTRAVADGPDYAGYYRNIDFLIQDPDLQHDNVGNADVIRLEERARKNV
jgi:hypothetical protein